MNKLKKERRRGSWHLFGRTRVKQVRSTTLVTPTIKSDSSLSSTETPKKASTQLSELITNKMISSYIYYIETPITKPKHKKLLAE